MDNKDLRRTAAEEFFESLEEELERDSRPKSPERSQLPKSKAPRSDRKTAKKDRSSGFSLSELEEAIEDIDQYLENKNPPILPTDS